MSELNEKDQEQPKPTTDLATELRELGQQLEQAARTFLESERAQTIRNDLSAGLRELSNQLQHAMEAIREDPKIQRLTERGQQAVSQAQDNPAFKDLQETLARGIAQVNQQLATFVERSRSGSATPATTGSQQVPIESEPATGETTRLES